MHQNRGPTSGQWQLSSHEKQENERAAAWHAVCQRKSTRDARKWPGGLYAGHWCPELRKIHCRARGRERRGASLFKDCRFFGWGNSGHCTLATPAHFKAPLGIKEQSYDCSTRQCGSGHTTCREDELMLIPSLLTDSHFTATCPPGGTTGSPVWCGCAESKEADAHERPQAGTRSYQKRPPPPRPQN